jgi:hypothetical protein
VLRPDPPLAPRSELTRREVLKVTSLPGGNNGTVGGAESADTDESPWNPEYMEDPRTDLEDLRSTVNSKNTEATPDVAAQIDARMKARHADWTREGIKNLFAQQAMADAGKSYVIAHLMDAMNRFVESESLVSEHLSQAKLHPKFVHGYVVFKEDLKKAIGELAEDMMRDDLKQEAGSITPTDEERKALEQLFENPDSQQGQAETRRRELSDKLQYDFLDRAATLFAEVLSVSTENKKSDPSLTMGRLWSRLAAHLAEHPIPRDGKVPAVGNQTGKCLFDGIDLPGAETPAGKIRRLPPAVANYLFEAMPKHLTDAEYHTVLTNLLEWVGRVGSETIEKTIGRGISAALLPPLTVPKGQFDAVEYLLQQDITESETLKFLTLIATRKNGIDDQKYPTIVANLFEWVKRVGSAPIINMLEGDKLDSFLELLSVDKSPFDAVDYLLRKGITKSETPKFLTLIATRKNGIDDQKYPTIVANLFEWVKRVGSAPIINMLEGDKIDSFLELLSVDNLQFDAVDYLAHQGTTESETLLCLTFMPPLGHIAGQQTVENGRHHTILTNLSEWVGRVGSELIKEKLERADQYKFLALLSVDKLQFKAVDYLTQQGITKSETLLCLTSLGSILGQQTVEDASYHAVLTNLSGLVDRVGSELIKKLLKGDDQLKFIGLLGVDKLLFEAVDCLAQGGTTESETLQLLTLIGLPWHDVDGQQIVDHERYRHIVINIAAWIGRVGVGQITDKFKGPDISGFLELLSVAKTQDSFDAVDYLYKNGMELDNIVELNLRVRPELNEVVKLVHDNNLTRYSGPGLVSYINRILHIREIFAHLSLEKAVSFCANVDARIGDGNSLEKMYANIDALRKIYPRMYNADEVMRCALRFDLEDLLVYAENHPEARLQTVCRMVRMRNLQKRLARLLTPWRPR